MLMVALGDPDSTGDCDPVLRASVWTRSEESRSPAISSTHVTAAPVLRALNRNPATSEGAYDNTTISDSASVLGATSAEFE